MNKTFTFAAASLMATAALPAATWAQNISQAGLFDKERFQVRLRAIDIIAEGEGNVDGTSTPTDVEDAFTAEVDLSYKMHKNWALEVIAATANHNINAGAGELGDAWIVPPTLTLQYHPLPDKAFSPYIGAGVNYSFFFGEDSSNGDKLDVDGGFGWAAQIGADYWLNDNWGLNVDAKYVNIDVDVQSGANTASNVELDPVIVGVGVSYRF